MTKPMARLEFEMPECCGDCPLLFVVRLQIKDAALKEHDRLYSTVCGFTKSNTMPNAVRKKNCPIKEANHD
jgi:hypothetical protein